MKLYFKNTNNWKNPYALLFDESKKISERIDLLQSENQLFAFDFDNNIYDHFCVCSENGEKSDFLYPGDLEIGLEFKRNDVMNKNLTYLFSLNAEKTGRVENFVLPDKANLSHREDMSKKISVFLPESYDGVTPHDILYFFDAQNLFANAGHYTENGDPYGSWQLDLVISQLHHQYGKNIIVVGIDNADMYRSQELFMDPGDFGDLSPLATAIPEDDFSRGYLDGLSEFMTSTLHEFIKNNYCVKEDNIGLGGSSMGGIASFYCGLRECGFYKYILSYSPAFGLYENSAFDNYFSKYDFEINQDKLPRVYIYCGGGDMLEEQLLPMSRQMKPLMVKHGYNADKIFERYDIDKPHNEESWRMILPDSFSLLLDL